MNSSLTSLAAKVQMPLKKRSSKQEGELKRQGPSSRRIEREERRRRKEKEAKEKARKRGKGMMRKRKNKR